MGVRFPPRAQIMEKFKKDLSYEENREGFGKWFRKEAKDKWEAYLNGNEKGFSLEESGAMRKFLIEQGTKEEIQTRLNSLLDSRILAYEALLEDIKSKRPDLKFN